MHASLPRITSKCITADCQLDSLRCCGWKCWDCTYCCNPCKCCNQWKYCCNPNHGGGKRTFVLSSFARDCKRDSLNRQSWISNLDRSLQERGFWEGLGHCVNPWYWRKALQHHVDQSYWVAYLYQVMDREDVVYDDGDEENSIYSAEYAAYIAASVRKAKQKHGGAQPNCVCWNDRACCTTATNAISCTCFAHASVDSAGLFPSVVPWMRRYTKFVAREYETEAEAKHRRPRCPHRFCRVASWVLCPIIWAVSCGSWRNCCLLEPFCSSGKDLGRGPGKTFDSPWIVHLRMRRLMWFGMFWILAIEAYGIHSAAVKGANSIIW